MGRRPLRQPARAHQPVLVGEHHQLGAALTLARPARTRIIAGTVQIIALLGTLVGVATIIAGIGPRTVPDLLYHTGILAVLAWGIAVSLRAERVT